MFKAIRQTASPVMSAFAPPSAEEQLWTNFIDEALAVERWHAFDFTELASARAILAAPDQSKALLLVIAIDAVAHQQARAGKLKQVHSNKSDNRVWKTATAAQGVISALLRTNLPLPAWAISALLQALVDGTVEWIGHSPASVLRAIERYASKQPLSDEHRQQLRRWSDSLARSTKRQSCQQSMQIQALLRDPSQPPQPVQIIESGEPWADAAIALRSTLSPAQITAWDAIFNHAATARSSTPSKKWLSTARKLIDDFGLADFVSALKSILPLVGQPGPGRPVMSIQGIVNEPTCLSPFNADLLKGIVWTAAVLTDPAIPPLVGDVAEICFKKIPGIGARCAKLANACLAALALIPGPAAVAQITRIQSKAKKNSARKVVERALDTSAASQGLSRDELQEMSIPDFGLSPTGTRSVPMGQFTAELRVLPPHDVQLRWRNESGKSQASIPAEVKQNHADALKELKRTVKDIQQVLPAQVMRLERLLLNARSWPLPTWRARYLDHPLMALIARRLIWRTDDPNPQLFAFLNGQLVDAQGRNLNIADAASIRLWHPIDSPAQIVQAWRAFLQQHQITQPFKQAHREIYVLTDAERQTETYSNRFAAHILRQHQFQALCDARGWTYRLMGTFDSHNTPSIPLPAWDTRVEFWMNQAHGSETSPAGIFLYIATDQVRFVRPDGQRRPLADVEPVLFSEMMRDVDLFVGVASVGNDPNWQDGGPNGRYIDYWNRISFGDLSESAKTRRAVLEPLLPRLTKLRDRWQLADRFLIIRGDLRTYKIHLGSGNILMEPNDQYLCIVPGRSATPAGEPLFLPFEGDQTLSVILSKAFLLAADKSIKDPTITRQISGR